MAAGREAVENLLRAADIVIDGARPWDIQVHDERFFPRVLAGGTLGFGEAYMDGWWDCAALDEMCCRALRARVEQRFSSSFANLIALATSLLINRRRDAVRVKSEKNITISGTISSRRCSIPGCNIPAPFSARETTSLRCRSASWR